MDRPSRREIKALLTFLIVLLIIWLGYMFISGWGSRKDREINISERVEIQGRRHVPDTLGSDSKKASGKTVTSKRKKISKTSETTKKKKQQSPSSPLEKPVRPHCK